jgi:choice-of-anchor A domain-containing protein
MKKAVLLVAALCVAPAICKADAVPFGSASAYNLVALGTVDANGNTLIAGTIGTNADVNGRVAAADQVLIGTTIGSTLNSDPWVAYSTYGLISTNGLVAGQTFNMNGGGNVFAPGTNGNINFNNGGNRVTSGSSGIDFSTLRTTLDAQTALLAGLAPNGVVGAATPPGGNPSWLVLKGTSTTLNVFDITAAQFADTNHNIDIEAPVGSTIVVNVAGTNLTLGTGLYYNGNQTSGDSAADANILFNFAGAQTVAINAQFNASVLAPFAILTGNGQMGGNFIAAQIGQTGEVHNIEFTGSIPSQSDSGPGKYAVTPEPGTLVLMGTGMMSMAALFRRRLKANQ